MLVRLEINDIAFLDLKDIFKPNLIIHQKPQYIEDDQSLQILFQNKFLTQQKFEFEKQLKETQTMTDLEDLFEGQMTLEIDVNSSSLNLMPKDEEAVTSH